LDVLHESHGEVGSSQKPSITSLVTSWKCSCSIGSAAAGPTPAPAPSTVSPLTSATAHDRLIAHMVPAPIRQVASADSLAPWRRWATMSALHPFCRRRVSRGTSWASIKSVPGLAKRLVKREGKPASSGARVSRLGRGRDPARRVAERGRRVGDRVSRSHRPAGHGGSPSSGRCRAWSRVAGRRPQSGQTAAPTPPAAARTLIPPSPVRSTPRRTGSSWYSCRAMIRSRQGLPGWSLSRARPVLLSPCWARLLAGPSRTWPLGGPRAE
jgi:hypothetical protein